MCGKRLRREPFDLPRTVGLPGVEYPVVQTVLAPLPEFDPHGRHGETSPMGGPFDRLSGGFHFVVQ